MFYFLDKKESLEVFSGNVLIVPAISVGNVGQLACDLLISNLSLKKVGYFSPQCFLPLVGNNPFSSSLSDQSILSINCEVYSDSRKQLTIMQIRSSLIKSKCDVFRNNLIEWIMECKFKELIILSSCHSYERSDQQLTGTPFRYISSSSESQISQFKNLGWIRLEERVTGHGEKELFLPGAGFTKSLFLDCSSSDVSATVLFVFCAEGDNIPEAVILTSHLNQWMRFISDSEKWKPPSSWVHLFGNLPPNELF